MVALKQSIDCAIEASNKEKERHATEVNTLKGQISKLEFEEVLTDAAYKVSCKKLFASNQQVDAQEETIILTNRKLQKEILKRKVELDLGFFSDRLDVLLPSERRAQLQQLVEPSSPVTSIAEENTKETIVEDLPPIQEKSQE